MLLQPDILDTGGGRRFTPAVTVSIAVHAAAVLAIALLVGSGVSQLDNPVTRLMPIVWKPDIRPPASGGGGRPTPTPARPQPVDAVVVTAPEPAVVVEEPPAITAEAEPRAVEAAAPGPVAAGPDSAPGGSGREGAGPGPGTGPGPGGPGTVYSVGNGVSSPVVIRRPPPSYTAAAMQARLQGLVVLTCVVMPDGICTNIRVIQSLDSVRGLDQQAIASARQWRFRPGTRLGEPVPVEVKLEIEFNIR